MADDEWISANDALALVAEATGGRYVAIRATCTRAHDGLIAAKAAKIISQKGELDDAAVHKGFWWAGGDAALTQNWPTGDFDTWIDDRLHVRAYGVSFSRADIM